jgi:hypothetical protein
MGYMRSAIEWYGGFRRYVLVPCCVGKLKEAGAAAKPRSRWLTDALGAGASVEFLALAAAADHKPPPSGERATTSPQGE